VPPEIDDQAGQLHHHGSMTRAPPLCLQRLLELFKMRAEQMLEIGRPWPVPCDREYLP